MEDKSLPDLNKFMQKLLPMERLQDAVARLEDYAETQFDAVHGAAMLTLVHEIEAINSQIVRSTDMLHALDQQRKGTPRTLKQSPLTQGGEPNEPLKKSR
jgi:hypothetical protein